MRLLVGAVVLLAVAGTAQARDCSGIQDPAKRLQCYDAGAGADRGGGSASGGRPYEGSWAAKASDCGRDDADGNFRIQGRLYKGWEQQCDIDKAVSQGDAWTLTMSCGGEGETWKETKTYAPLSGGRLSLRDKGRAVASYVACSAPAAASTGTDGAGSASPAALDEWAYDADRKMIWSCDDFGEGKAKACLAFACDYKSPTMTFFTRGAPVRADVDVASGGSTSMPSTGSQEEKDFARLFKMGARTRVLDGTEELKTIFEGMKRRPIAVAAGRDRWSFATAAGRSEKPVADFRAECIW